MKIQKFNERSLAPNTYWIFQDEFLKIRKLPGGPFKGKILFKFYQDINNWDVCSMILGCAKLINTKYEHNNQLREITIGEYRKLNTSSINAILRLFCQNDEELITRFKKEWTDEIQNIANSATNLGDIIDGFKNSIYYDQADLILKPRKYNL